MSSEMRGVKRATCRVRWEFSMEVFSVPEETYTISNEAFPVEKCDVFRVTWDKLRFNFRFFCCGGVFRVKRDVFIIKWGVFCRKMRRIPCHMRQTTLQFFNYFLLWRCIRWQKNRIYYQMRRLPWRHATYFVSHLMLKDTCLQKKKLRIQRELLNQTKCISYYEINFVWHTYLSNETYFVCLFSNVVRLFLFVSFQM